MKAGFAVVLLACCGCMAGPAPSALRASSADGLFHITAQSQKQPTVAVENNTDSRLRLLMNGPQGSVITLDVGPHQKDKVDVPTGHYEAKVFDPDGKVQSAFGSADIQEYKTYITGFVVSYGGNHTFHIGDSGR